MLRTGFFVLRASWCNRLISVPLQSICPFLCIQFIVVSLSGFSKGHNIESGASMHSSFFFHFIITLTVGVYGHHMDALAPFWLSNNSVPLVYQIFDTNIICLKFGGGHAVCSCFISTIELLKTERVLMSVLGMWCINVWVIGTFREKWGKFAQSLSYWELDEKFITLVSVR